MLNAAQQLVDFHRHRQETVAAQNPGRHELPRRNKVAQAEQRHFRQVTVLLKLFGDDFCVGRGGGEINHDQVRTEPTRGVNGESGIVFFADGIFTRSFKSPAHDACDSRVMIDKKNFFQDRHKLPLFRALVMPVEDEAAATP